MYISSEFMYGGSAFDDTYPGLISVMVSTKEYWQYQMPLQNSLHKLELNQKNIKSLEICYAELKCNSLNKNNLNIIIN